MHVMQFDVCLGSGRHAYTDRHMRPSMHIHASNFLAVSHGMAAVGAQTLHSIILVKLCALGIDP